MGTSCEIANIADRGRKIVIAKLLVDTGSEFTWAPREELERIGVGLEKKDQAFLMANGQQITRSVGFALVRVGDRFTGRRNRFR